MPLRIRLRPREERSEARYSGGDEVRGSPRRLAVPVLQAKKRKIRSALTKRTGRYGDTNRLTEAEKLLITTSRSISQIALDTGFSTSSYFITQFKKHKNITPKQLKQKIISSDSGKKGSA